MSRFPGDLLLGRRFKWPPVTGHRAVVTGRIVGNCISGGSGLAAAAAPVYQPGRVNIVNKILYY